MHAELREWCTENLMWLSCELTKVMGPIIGGPDSQGQGRMGWGTKFVPLLVQMLTICSP